MLPQSVSRVQNANVRFLFVMTEKCECKVSKKEVGFLARENVTKNSLDRRAKKV